VLRNVKLFYFLFAVPVTHNEGKVAEATKKTFTLFELVTKGEALGLSL
jgi:hypothetical protein